MLVIFHISVVCLYSFAIWYDQKYVEITFPVKEFEYVPFKGRAIFFTFWTLCFIAGGWAAASLEYIYTSTANSPAWRLWQKPPMRTLPEHIPVVVAIFGGSAAVDIFRLKYMIVFYYNVVSIGTIMRFLSQKAFSKGAQYSAVHLLIHIGLLLGIYGAPGGTSVTSIFKQFRDNERSWILQTLYFMVAILNDVIGTNAASKKPPFIRKLKDVLFSITLTTALYVVLVFWAFYTFDKTLLFPNEEAEKQFPKWLNHTMHTLILPVILIELFVTKRNYPSKKTGFSVAIWLTAIYATYIHVMYFTYGIWPYPFLYVVSWTTKTMHFIGSAVLAMSFYLFGEKLDSLLSRSTMVTQKKEID